MLNLPFIAEIYTVTQLFIIDTDMPDYWLKMDEKISELHVQ